MDIEIHIPLWLVYGTLEVRFWYLTMPAVIALILIGWHGAPWLGAARWVAFAIAALLAVPFSITGAWIILDKMRTDAAMAAHSQTLEQDETVAGVPLPAGSRITFKDEAHLHIHSVDLPGAASFSFKGMEVTG